VKIKKVQWLTHLGNPLALNGLLLELAEVVVVGHHVRDDGFLVRRIHVHVLCAMKKYQHIEIYGLKNQNFQLYTKLPYWY
jgi:hypothetical protein